MSDSELDQEIMKAIGAGNITRDRLMAIQCLRHRTWAVVAKRLAVLCKRGTLIASKSGWRVA